MCANSATTQIARWHAIAFPERSVEAPHTDETRGRGDLRDRPVGVGQKLLGQQQALRRVHRHRRRAEPIDKAAAQMA
jgi:hypothetical protein